MSYHPIILQMMAAERRSELLRLSNTHQVVGSTKKNLWVQASELIRLVVRILVLLFPLGDRNTSGEPRSKKTGSGRISYNRESKTEF